MKLSHITEFAFRFFLLATLPAAATFHALQDLRGSQPPESTLSRENSTAGRAEGPSPSNNNNSNRTLDGCPPEGETQTKGYCCKVLGKKRKRSTPTSVRGLVVEGNVDELRNYLKQNPNERINWELFRTAMEYHGQGLGNELVRTMAPFFYGDFSTPMFEAEWDLMANLANSGVEFGEKDRRRLHQIADGRIFDGNMRLCQSTDRARVAGAKKILENLENKDLNKPKPESQ